MSKLAMVNELSLFQLLRFDFVVHLIYFMSNNLFNRHYSIMQTNTENND